MTYLGDTEIVKESLDNLSNELRNDTAHLKISIDKLTASIQKSSKSAEKQQKFLVWWTAIMATAILLQVALYFIR